MAGSRSVAEDQLDALIASIDQTVLFLDADLRVSRCSAGHADWLPFSDIPGRTLNDLFPDDKLKKLTTAMARAAANGAPQHLDLELRPEHLPAWRELGLREVHHKHVTLSHCGSDGGWLIVMRDTTELKRLARGGAGQTQRDPLTGAYNRRAFMPVLGQSLAQAQRYDWPCSLMMFDIDGFGRINDRFGWDTGDRVLRQLVSAMLAKKRGSDFFARYENDCFVMFMPETNLNQGLLAAERVRKLVGGLVIKGPEGDFNCTLSIGVTSLQSNADDAESLLARVAENLYVARQSGGNRSEGDS